MSFFGWLTGKDKVVDMAGDVVKGGMEMLDEAFHTDQEKQEGVMKVLDWRLRVMEALTNQSHGTAVSRRWLAWGVTFMTGVAFFTAMGISVYGNLFAAGPDMAKRSEAAVEDIIQLVDAFMIGWAFAGVVGFYFLTHVVKARAQ